MNAIQLLDHIANEIRRNMRRLCIHDRIFTFRVQQYLVHTREHAVCLQQLRALCFDALLEQISRPRFS